MLNKNQEKAVNFKEGPCLALAGPGSGKTTVLTLRISKLIESGVDPKTILVITFTKDAANEMKSRYKRISNDKKDDVTFGTFHSIFYRILKSHKKYKDFEIVYGTKKIALYKECAKLLKLNISFDEMYVDLEKTISYYYNSGGHLPEEGLLNLDEEDFFKYIDLLEDRKEKHRYIDFDDMLFKTKNLLENDKECLKYWQGIYSFFLVDELQDINKVQFEVLKLLLANHPCGKQNIFGVGDDDQSIYGFRGANPRFMLEFPDAFKGCEIINLDTNYRSASLIVESAKRLIENNENRYFKDIIPNSTDAGSVSIKEFLNDYEEASFIINLLEEEIGNNNLIDTGILYRNRSQSMLIQALLKAKKIEYFSDDMDVDIRNTEVCKDFVAYFKLIAGEYKRGDIIRVMNKPDRGLSRGGLDEESVSINEWRDFYPKDTDGYMLIDRFINSIELMKRLSPASCINYIMYGLGYNDYIINHKTAAGVESNLSYIEDIKSYAKSFDSLKELIKDLGVVVEKKKAKRTNEKISLFTFHGSKGLEFDRVFILDAIEKNPANTKSMDIEAICEERRMFYVAMTRAKNELIICIPKNFKGELAKKSHFVEEIFEKNKE